MFVRNFSSKCIHAESSLPRLDISPDLGCHIALIVHEASIEIRSLIRIWPDDVRAAAREWVFQEMGHREEFAMRHKHMVFEEAVLISMFE